MKLQGRLNEHGHPVANVSIIRTDQRGNILSPLRMFDYKALLDTGATHSCAVPKVISNCQLIGKGGVTTRVANGTLVNSRLFFAAICFGNSIINQNKSIKDAKSASTSIVLAEMEMKQENFQIIIGMDLLKFGSFLLKSNSFHFSID